MKNLHCWLLVVGLLLVSIAHAALTVTRASNSATEYSTPIYSSLRGGKYVYITGSGFDSVKSTNNKVELVPSSGTTLLCPVEN